MIKIYSKDDTLKYCEENYAGYKFTYKDIPAVYGVSLGTSYKAIPVDIVIEVLDEINKVFSLHWCNADIFLAPFRPMMWDEKRNTFEGTEYNGRANKDFIILGARKKEVVKKEIASMLIHELWHVFTYDYVDENPFDQKDTETYKKFKELMGIKNFTDKSVIWEDRPSEILAELGRYFSENKLFTWENFDTFDEKNDPKPVREAYDFLISLIPPKSIDYKDFLADRDKYTKEEEKPIEEHIENPTIDSQDNKEVPTNNMDYKNNICSSKKIKIAIDNGHGLNTAGKRTPKFADGTFMHEWEFNHAVALYLKTELIRCGFDVLMLSDTEVDTPLKTRTDKCNSENCDFCISIHYNALNGIWGPQCGSEVFSYPGNANDKKYALAIHPFVIEATGFKDRGCKEENFHMVREPKCPAVLIEFGFMDNLEEATKARSEEFRKRCGVYTAKGICKAFNKEYITEVTLPIFDIQEDIKKNGTLLTGKSVATKDQLKQYLLNVNPNPKINCSVDDLINYFLTYGNKENIRGDIAFCQSVHETGWFRFGGQVLPAQNNYAGIGATNDSGVGKGAWFDTPELGAKAQIQHLKAYANTSALTETCVDPRFSLVNRGSAPYVEQLAQALNPKGTGWAYPGYSKTVYKTAEDAYKAKATYGQSILKHLTAALDIKITNDNTEEIERLNKQITILQAEIIELKKCNTDYKETISRLQDKLNSIAKIIEK